jgi:hypothetical protein
MDIKKLQEEVNRRWAVQKDNPCHGADSSHALVHMMKALGKIASAFNDAEHEGRAPRDAEIGKPLADLVICAARFADDIVDLDAACAARLDEKFPDEGTRLFNIWAVHAEQRGNVVERGLTAEEASQKQRAWKERHRSTGWSYEIRPEGSP